MKVCVTQNEDSRSCLRLDKQRMCPRKHNRRSTNKLHAFKFFFNGKLPNYLNEVFSMIPGSNMDVRNNYLVTKVIFLKPRITKAGFHVYVSHCEALY